jgi:hypothetical protein
MLIHNNISLLLHLAVGEVKSAEPVAERSGFIFTAWAIHIPLLHKKQSIPVLGFAQSHSQWVSGLLSLCIKWPERDADHSPLSGIEFNNGCNYISTIHAMQKGTFTTFQ